MVTGEEEDHLFDQMLLTNAVHRLPDRQQIVVALRSAGYTQRQCGEIVGRTRAAIGFIYKAALRNIRKILAEELGEVRDDGNT